MGDAGALITNDSGLAERARAMREHGQTRKYHHELLGYTARLDTIQALVLLRKLPFLDGWNADRARAAELYSEGLEGVGDIRLPPVVAGSRPAWYVYVIRTGKPEMLSEFLARRRIATSRHYPVPPHLSPAYAHLGHRPGSFPVAEALAGEGLSLPIFPGISETQQEAVCDAIRAYFAGA
jgi:dTDP-4-amino-4,6-dideoxygalactose transaminase